MRIRYFVVLKTNQNHFAYSYEKVVPWILTAFLLAVVTPMLVESLRYGELRWLWQIGSFGSFILMIAVNLFAVGNGFFTLMEFAESGKYNWYWFFLGIIPVLFYGGILLFALISSPD